MDRRRVVVGAIAGVGLFAAGAVTAVALPGTASAPAAPEIVELAATPGSETSGDVEESVVDEPVEDAAVTPSVAPRREPTVRSDVDEPKPEPVDEPKPESEPKEPVKEPVKEAVKEPVKESEPKPESEPKTPVKEPVKESEPKTPVKEHDEPKEPVKEHDEPKESVKPSVWWPEVHGYGSSCTTAGDGADITWSIKLWGGDFALVSTGGNGTGHEVVHDGKVLVHFSDTAVQPSAQYDHKANVTGQVVVASTQDPSQTKTLGFDMWVHLGTCAA